MKQVILENALTQKQKDRGYHLEEVSQTILCLCLNWKIVHSYPARTMTVCQLREDTENHLLAHEFQNLLGDNHNEID